MALQALPLLVGRENELAALTAALDAASLGTGSTHCLVGESGIGKTRLATAFGARAAEHGAQVVLGRAYPVETGVPYAAVADACVPWLRGRPAGQVQTLTRGGLADLQILFPNLPMDAASAPAMDRDERKPRAFDTFWQLLRRLAELEPLVLTVENLQFADPSSLELLHFLARQVSGSRILLLCSHNQVGGAGNPVLRDMERSLRSLGAVTVHHLAALNPVETAELVTRRFAASGNEVTAFASRLQARTGGNPFFIEETLKSLVESGQLRDTPLGWVGWEDEWRALPTSVRDALGARLERLGSAVRHVATVAAVVGAEVPHDLLKIVAGLAPADLAAATDELLHERILVECEGSDAPAYDFSHPLLPDVLQADLSRVRLQALHAQIGDGLERLYGAEAMEHASRLAVHFLRARDAVQAPRAVRYLVEAGRTALGCGADLEADAALSAALEIADGGGAEVPDALLELLARAKQRRGQFDASADLWRRLAARAGERGDLARLAVLHGRLGMIAFRQSRFDDAFVAYESGLGAAQAGGAAAEEARLLIARGTALLEVGNAEASERDARAALTIAEHLREPRLLARVHHALQSLAVWRGPPQQAREHGEQSLAFANAAGDRAAAWTAHWGMAMQAGLTGDAAGTRTHVAAARAIAEELRSPLRHQATSGVEIQYRAAVGEWDDALALADRTIADTRAYGQHTLLVRILVWTALIRLGRGDFERARTEVDEAWALSGAETARPGRHVNVHAVVPAHVGLAGLHLAHHDCQEAIRVGEAGLAIADGTGYVAWTVHRLLPILAEACLWSRDWDRARHYGERLRDTSNRLGNPLGLAWADACAALLRLAEGDTIGATTMLDHAAAGLEAIPMVEHAARLRQTLADAYASAGDGPSAIRELRRCHTVFARLGAAPALHRVREKLRALGARPPARPSNGAGAGLLTLTGRENEIAHLVAERRSNKEIGAALGISARTVGTHLANMFVKLGIDSRGALTDLVRASGNGATARAVRR